MSKLILLFAFLYTVSVSADCNNDSNNLISASNCAFDSGIDESDVWGLSDSIIHDPTEDFLSQGLGHGSALIGALYQGSFFSSFTNMHQYQQR